MRLIKRYIPPQSEFDLIEVERTDFLPLSGCTQRQVAEMSVLYEHGKCWTRSMNENTEGLGSYASIDCYVYINIVFYDLCAHNNVCNILENFCLGSVDD